MPIPLWTRLYRGTEPRLPRSRGGSESNSPGASLVPRVEGKFCEVPPSGLSLYPSKGWQGYNQVCDLY